MNICCYLNLSLREIAPSHNSRTCFAGKGLNLSDIVCVTVIMLPIKSCTGTAGLCGMKPVRCRPVVRSLRFYTEQICLYIFPSASVLRLRKTRRPEGGGGGAAW